ncbi:polysaccharide deacetylase family protein [Peptostreptococcus equinus]|uniref:Polysaccharide deacetylase n=1 Tax=Peptostreptococcus equinus TaxID=3003601 RepID=A0ABY7JQR8_9FIRM|nr:polysaccharide deacetylase family protein [Peptostreptococcus sp. CBA3647]WAW15699.1 polysaccharide deacetylase [Peptostreptococcus sp. CBA3647]
MDNDDRIVTQEDINNSKNKKVDSEDIELTREFEPLDNNAITEESISDDEIVLDQAKESNIIDEDMNSIRNTDIYAKHNRIQKLKDKKKNKTKKTILFIIILLSILLCVGIFVAYKLNPSSADINADNKTNLEFEKMLDEKNNKNKAVIGQKEDAKKIYGVDAAKVWNSLNTYDIDNNGKKEVFLTFDDGPSTTNTPKVLKILNDNNVKGTFFVTGKAQTIDGAPQILRQLYDNGMAIGNHSYSHDYTFLYPKRIYNEKNFLSDIKKNEKKIQESLGMPNFTTRVIRCPGGQMSWQKTEPLNNYFIANDMVSMDWNSLNGDAEPPKKDAKALYDFAVKESKGKNLIVLLMHDTYGKEETVKYLDNIIKYYKSQGYEFKTLV